MKPLIGITTYLGDKNTVSSVSMNYIDSILMAGGIPVTLPIVNDEACIVSYADMLDGILFTGGVDIAPYYYGENPVRQLGKVSSKRDEFELSLFKAAYKKNMPILGICKGIQLINVALGGSLYQDIPSQIPKAFGHSAGETDTDELYHSVNIERDSLLFGIFGEEEMLVNSFHHQSVKEVGNSLTATAHSEDGVIEAVESLEDRFILGVQWHPECLTKRYPEFLRLFESFVHASEKYRQKKA